VHLSQHTAPGVVPDALRPYSVTVTVCGGDQSVLLALVSALHRRQVEVLTVGLTERVADRRQFKATIMTTARQARTVEATLDNLIPVTEAEVVPSRTWAVVPHCSANGEQRAAVNVCAPRP